MLHCVTAGLLALSIAACSRTVGDTFTTRVPVAVATAIMTPTQSAAAATAAAIPVVLPTAVPTVQGKSAAFKTHFVALNDDGKRGKKIGCNDSLIPVTLAVAESDKPIANALNQLFAVKSNSYGQSGLYNALSQSSLTVDSTDVDATGKVLVKLKGTVKLGGTCDAPRAVEQIRETVTQFSWSKNATITINGQPLDAIGDMR